MAFFSNKVFLIKVCTLVFRHTACRHRLQYSINIIFICTGKEKNLCDLLHCDLRFIAGVWNQTLDISEMPVTGVPLLPPVRQGLQGNWGARAGRGRCRGLGLAWGPGAAPELQRIRNRTHGFFPEAASQALAVAPARCSPRHRSRPCALHDGVSGSTRGCEDPGPGVLSGRSQGCLGPEPTVPSSGKVSWVSWLGLHGPVGHPCCHRSV